RRGFLLSLSPLPPERRHNQQQRDRSAPNFASPTSGLPSGFPRRRISLRRHAIWKARVKSDPQKNSIKNAAAINQDRLAGDKVAVRGRKIDENAEQILRGLQSLHGA